MTMIIPNRDYDLQAVFGEECINQIPKLADQHRIDKLRPATQLWVDEQTLNAMQKAIDVAREEGRWQPIPGEPIDIEEGKKFLGLVVHIIELLDPGRSIRVC